MITFRIDDVSLNTPRQKLDDIHTLIDSKFPGSKIIHGISICSHNLNSEIGLQQERVFPKILNAYSDHRRFYQVDRFGSIFISGATIASHGLIHVDHRLLSMECQEMSILVSCSLLKTKIFIPPFNKWNQATADICAQNGIELIRFEDGWKHLKYEPISGGKFYFHTHDFTLDDLEMALDSTYS